MAKSPEVGQTKAQRRQEGGSAGTEGYVEVQLAIDFNSNSFILRM